MMLIICVRYKQNNKETLSMYGICNHVRRNLEGIFSDTEMGTEKIFSRNKGSFEKLKKCHDLETKLYVIVVPKKELPEPVLYLPQLQKVIEVGSYVSVQICAIETTMLWKPLNNITCPFEE